MTIFQDLCEAGIVTGDILGHGSFTTVKAVKTITEPSAFFGGETSDDDTDATATASIALTSDPYHYAVKEVRNELTSFNLRQARYGLANEVNILSSLQHPNVITIHGAGQISRDKSHFLLLERLCTTVERQIKVWKRKEKKKARFALCGVNKFTAEAQIWLWNERIKAARDLASAMAFLHRNSIIHRDIKPANAGFDFEDNLKLFDFGLARELSPETKIGLNQFKFTGDIGSRRYMAPEVARSLPYGTPIDVYSFAIMFWEMLSLKRAFENETQESHARKVFGYRSVRPRINTAWPRLVKQLIRDSWSADPRLRPSFTEIHHYLCHC